MRAHLLAERGQGGFDIALALCNCRKPRHRLCERRCILGQSRKGGFLRGKLIGYGRILCTSAKAAKSHNRCKIP